MFAQLLRPPRPGDYRLPVLMRRFLPLLGPLRWTALSTAFLVLATPLLSILLIYLAKRVIDDVMIAGRLDLLPTLAVAATIAASCRLALDYAATRLEADVVESVFRSLRTMLYRRFITLSPGSLGKRDTGDQLARLSGDVDRTELLVFTGPLTVVADIAAVAYFSVFLFILSWKLTLCALLALPLLAFASWRYAPRVRRASRVARHRTSAWMSLADERLDAVAMVQVCGAQDFEVAAFDGRCAEAKKAELRAVSIQAWMTLLIEAGVTIGVGGVFLLGAYEIASDALTVGMLVAFAGAVGSLYDPARGLARASARFQRSAAGAQRVAEILDTPSLVTEPAAPRSILRARGAIEFRDVDFSHRGGAQVLQGASLLLDPGETVALVGSSGAGKSTLASLAVRLYDPDAGAVLLDGVDLRELSFDTLRRSFAAVFQDAFLFRGSILDNIKYGLDVPAADIAAAARLSHLEEFAAARPGGYLSQVGGRGANLSGGQRQRVAMARAFLRQAPVLILDEATSGVDSETEELIQEALVHSAGMRTTLVIAHRLSSVRRADRVAVLEGGRIVEIGAPDEVLRPGSRFSEIFAAQMPRSIAA